MTDQTDFILAHADLLSNITRQGQITDQTDVILGQITDQTDVILAHENLLSNIPRVCQITDQMDVI
jgi:hypothetical protein